jgi:hypothetical protein
METLIPAAYCDTSFILEYWQAYVEHEGSAMHSLELRNRPKYFDYVKSLLKSESRFERLKPIRRLIDSYDIETNLISSVFALTELYEKHAEWNFKATIADATNIDRTFNKGKKDVGDLITKVYRGSGEERDMIFGSLFPHELSNSIFGIEFKDIKALSFTSKAFFSKYSILSVLQVGTTDILHLIAAKKLGAKYILTFDSDFGRVRDVIENLFNIEVLSSISEIENYFSKLPSGRRGPFF